MKYVLLSLLSFVFTAQAFALSCVGRYQTGSTWGSPGIIVSSYNLPNVAFFLAERKCADLNKAKAHADTNSQTVANAACAKGVSNGTVVQSFSKAGALSTGGYDHIIGYLKRGAAVYSCPQGGSISGTNCVASVAYVVKCPAGWLNSNNQDGGVATTANSCKKAHAGCTLPNPLPANGTQIGSSTGYWTWGNGIWISSSSVNGGVPTGSCPAGYSVSGSNCVKSYPATVVTAAFCKF